MPKNVKQTLMGADLDITQYPRFWDRDKIFDGILKDVKDTQLFVGRNLPDKLYMTFDQFQIMEDDIQQLDHTEFRTFLTPYNVMEVYIIDAPQVVDVEYLTGIDPDDGGFEDAK